MARRIIANLNATSSSPIPLYDPIEPLYPASSLLGLIPPSTRIPIDMKQLIARLVDGSRFQEFKGLYGTTLITGFARIWGIPVGILGNQGVLMAESAVKGAHFIELCTKRKIPLLFLQNITGKKELFFSPIYFCYSFFKKKQFYKHRLLYIVLNNFSVILGFMVGKSAESGMILIILRYST